MSAWTSWQPEKPSDIIREEHVNGYRICEMRGGGVRVTKDTYFAWSNPGDFEREKSIALLTGKLAPTQ